MRSQKRFKLFLLPAIIASSYIYSCSLNKDKFKDDFEEIVKEIEDRLPSNKTDGTVLPITPIDEVIETGPGADQEPEVEPKPEPESEPEPEPEPEVEPEPEIEPEPEPEVINKFLIKWFNHDGTLLEESEVNAGELPHYCGETPQQSNDTDVDDFNYFVGWDKEVVPATEDANYTAQFAIKEYTEDKFEYILSEDETYYEVTRASDDISGDLVLPSMHNGLPIKKVADNAFTLGGSLSDGLKIDSIYIPYGIEEIGEYAFKCINGLKEVYIPSTVKTINKEAFFGNNYITKITINDGVESIGSNAFYDIPKVKDFTFPKSLKNAGISAFHGFARETGFIVPGDCKLEEVGNKAFFYSGIVSGDFSNLKTLGRETFNSCYYLTDVKLSNKLEVIPYACFSDCRKLSSVQLPFSLNTLERDAFSNCPALEEVVLPPNITSIPYNLFYNDTNLKKVICLGEITSIDNYAFGKTALNSLIINDINKITSIGEGAFSNCNYFPGFPENIDTISNYLYSGNTSIRNISFPDHIKTINDWAFKGCSNLKHVNLNKVEKINEMAFKESGLEEITLSSTITSFGNEVFADCVNLKTATLPENMETIPSGFFKGCKSLVNITLPESLTSIGANSFNGCEEMDNINLPSSLTSIGEAAFSSTSISEINIPLNVSEHTKAFKDNETLQTISFEEGITTLKGSVLLNCTNLETINLPSTITTIEVLAISGCINLKNINFNGTMEQWNAISKLTSTTGSGRSKKTHKWNGTNTDLVTGFTINCSDGEIAC